MPLRVLTYNILLGGQDRLPHLLAILQRQQPDVVALIEANVQEHVTTLAEALGMQWAFGEANYGFHIAWLSRFPILQSINHRQPAFTKTLLEIVVEWRQEPLHLFASHLEPFPTHSGEERRLTEVMAMLAVVQASAGQLQLLAGDFNALSPTDSTSSPPSPALPDEAAQQAAQLYQVPRLAIQELLNAGFVDCFRRLRPDLPGYTYPAASPMARIDYLFASPRLAPLLHSCEVICGTAETATASDHCPVQAEFVEHEAG